MTANITRYLQMRRLTVEFANRIPPPEFPDYWQHNASLLKGCRMVVADPQYGENPFDSELCARTVGTDSPVYLGRYFAADELLFLNDQIANITTLKQSGTQRFPLDQTMMFDSNFVGATHTFMHGKSLDAKRASFLEAARFLRKKREKIINTDALPYLFENLERASRSEKHRQFTINGFAAFYRFTTGRYRNGQLSDVSDFQFDMTADEAKQHSTRVVQNFLTNPIMWSEPSRGLWDRRDTHYSLLLIATEYYSNRHSTLEDKLLWLMQEHEKNVHRIPERELLFALRLFTTPKADPFFADNWPENYNREEDISDLIRNMAWDTSFYRIMETWASKGDRGDFAVPFFLTFDQRLGQLNSIFGARILLIDSIGKQSFAMSSNTLQGELAEKGMWPLFEKFFTPERIATRMQAPKPSYEEMDSLCKRAEQSLRQVVYG